MTWRSVETAYLPVVGPGEPLDPSICRSMILSQRQREQRWKEKKIHAYSKLTNTEACRYSLPYTGSWPANHLGRNWPRCYFRPRHGSLLWRRESHLANRMGRSLPRRLKKSCIHLSVRSENELTLGLANAHWTCWKKYRRFLPRCQYLQI